MLLGIFISLVQYWIFKQSLLICWADSSELIPGPYFFMFPFRKQRDGKSVAPANIQAKKKRDAEFNSADITALGKRPKLEDFSTDDLK